MVAKAYASGIPVLKKVANSLLAHRTGIFSWYSKPISTGPLEGMKIRSNSLKDRVMDIGIKSFFNRKFMHYAKPPKHYGDDFFY